MIPFLKQYLRKYWYFFLGAFLCLILTNYLTILIPLKIQTIIDYYPKASESHIFPHRALLGIILLALGMLLVRSFSRVLMFYPGRAVEHEIRKDIYSHIMSLPQSFFRKNSVGDMMCHMVEDVNNIRLMVGLVSLHFFNTFLIYTFSLYHMFQIDRYLMLIVMSPVPFILLCVRVLSKKLSRYTGKSQEELSRLTKCTIDFLSKVSFIKVSGSQNFVQTVFDEINGTYETSYLKMCRIRAQMFSFIGIINTLGHLVLFVVGGKMLTKETLSIGEFVAFSFYLNLWAWPTASLAWIIHLLQQGRASIKRIQNIMKNEPPLEIKVSSSFDKKTLPVHLEVKDLSFSFEKEVLKNVSFSVLPGKSLGVFGVTGSGKTVLANVLAGIEKAPEETVMINGSFVEKWSHKEYQNLLSYVPQSTFLFSQSVCQNITFEKSFKENKLLEKKLKKVAQVASIDKEIETLAKGYDTIIGVKGAKLSGGQRQRVSLARALFKPHGLLVLDDVLSSLDSETESMIVDNLFGGECDATKIIISHRTSILSKCDHILVLDEGRCLAQGTHKSLLLEEGLYRETWKYQRALLS
ncbi:hypothetical protein AB834_04665 [PVC group bacterium (ex Bugula neritina AB1)]|nr:hypothetical protein AB834_04665 [PVC group bacterium (ex Bugula neritina AB1)]